MSVMPDSRWLRRMLVFGLLGVAAMTVVVPGILLARGTTGHDWYSAGKLTLEEAILAMGFSKYTAVAYRREYGDTWNIMRAAFVDFGPPVRARQRILATIGDGVMLGGGIGGTVFCLMLLGAAGHLRRGRTVASVEPVAYPYRHPAAWSPAGRIAGWLRSGGGRGRVGLVVMVSAADIEDLPEVDGFVEFANFPPDGGTGRAGPAGRFVPRAGALAAWRAPALLEGKGDQGAETATPAKTDTTGNRKPSSAPVRPDANPASADHAGAQPGATGKPVPTNPDGHLDTTDADNSTKDKADARRTGRGQNFY